MLTKEQKDGLITTLYGPMFSLVADLRPPKGAEWPDAHELSRRSIGQYKAKAKFESRVLAILNVYLSGSVDKDALPPSVPVLSAEEVAAASANTKEAAMKWLSEFKWEDLKSDDYDTARRAWYHLDGLRGVCSLHDDTKAWFEAALKDSGIKV